MIILDTTVLVYAVGTDHEFREPCQALLRAIAASTVRATTTPEVIQEFTHVRARRRGRTDATGLAEGFVDLLRPLVVVDESVLRAGLAIAREHEGIGTFDAVLCATARAVAADALVSADAAFGTVPGIRHEIPTTPAVERLVRGSGN